MVNSRPIRGRILLIVCDIFLRRDWKSPFRKI